MNIHPTVCHCLSPTMKLVEKQGITYSRAKDGFSLGERPLITMSKAVNQPPKSRLSQNNSLSTPLTEATSRLSAS